MVTPNRTSAIHIGIFEREFSSPRHFFQVNIACISTSVRSTPVSALLVWTNKALGVSRKLRRTKTLRMQSNRLRARFSPVEVLPAAGQRRIPKIVIIFCSPKKKCAKTVTLFVSPIAFPAGKLLVAQARSWSGIRQQQEHEPWTANYSAGSRSIRSDSSQSPKAPCPGRFRSQPKKTNFDQC